MRNGTSSEIDRLLGRSARRLRLERGIKCAMISALLGVLLVFTVEVPSRFVPMPDWRAALAVMIFGVPLLTFLMTFVLRVPARDVLRRAGQETGDEALFLALVATPTRLSPLLEREAETTARHPRRLRLFVPTWARRVPLLLLPTILLLIAPGRHTIRRDGPIATDEETARASAMIATLPMDSETRQRAEDAVQALQNGTPEDAATAAEALGDAARAAEGRDALAQVLKRDALLQQVAEAVERGDRTALASALRHAATELESGDETLRKRIESALLVAAASLSSDDPRRLALESSADAVGTGSGSEAAAALEGLLDPLNSIPDAAHELAALAARIATRLPHAGTSRSTANPESSAAAPTTGLASNGPSENAADRALGTRSATDTLILQRYFAWSSR